MLDKNIIESLVNDYLQNTDIQSVSVEVSEDNDIKIVLDSPAGVDLDFCTSLSRHLETCLDRDKEDFSLEVGSMSLTDPFRTPLQYQKNLGNPIIVTLQDGKKIKGVLTDVTDDGFEIEYVEKVRIEGKKRPEKNIFHIRYAFSDPVSVVYDLKI